MCNDNDGDDDDDNVDTMACAKHASPQHGIAENDKKEKNVANYCFSVVMLFVRMTNWWTLLLLLLLLCNKMCGMRNE